MALDSVAGYFRNPFAANCRTRRCRWHTDQGLLESALTRAQNLAAYADPTVFALAAAYGFGIARHHPFLDGNKRTAFVATRLFLAIHGWTVEASAQEKIDIFLRLAAGDLSEEILSPWLQGVGKPLS